MKWAVNGQYCASTALYNAKLHKKNFCCFLLNKYLRGFQIEILIEY